MSGDWIVDGLLGHLDRHKLAQPLHRQLYAWLREAIRSGRLAGGTAVPPSRRLAETLQLGRNTVLAAYEQLLAEGYLVTRQGAGTFVADLFTKTVPSDAAQPASRVGLSSRGQALASRANLPQGLTGAFAPGVPEIQRFPHTVWQTLLHRHRRTALEAWHAYTAEGGLPALREALCEYLFLSRGVRTTPERVLIVQGAQQGLDLAARLLADAGDPVWMEDPGYAGAHAAFAGAGLNLVPVAVDEQGLNPAAAPAGPTPRLIYLTPSHQYPTGVVMPLARRLALLDYARTHGCWLIEDDYDSEFRYASAPLSSLQGLAEDGPVIYVGTFSKVMFPALRLGYMVLPEGLVAAFRSCNMRFYRESDYAVQAALAAFITQGHLARHVRRMRELYPIRQGLLREVLQRRLGDALVLSSGEAGLHLLAHLPQGVDERALSAAGAAQRLWLRPLGRHRLGEASGAGLVLGYAGVEERALHTAAHVLADLLEDALDPPNPV